MKYGLGIDTGGTYTDAVIYDFGIEKVLHTAKSITVKEDLTIGINNTLDQLPQESLRQVKIVSLSTTLATNACVEGKGRRRTKLILIGCDKEILEKYGMEYGLPDASDVIFLSGGHGQKGEIIKEPDWNILKSYVDECKEKVEAFAIVELWGIRNSDFERKAKDSILKWTAKQTVCGHELTGEINSLRRAASAVLNAQLIPLIDDFINAVKKSLKEKRIEAPLVIVRGDGSLMSEEYARAKPVETLISGPSASVLGGTKLTGEKDCIIIDMGGTTSDLAVVKNGSPKLALEGANVGKWRTGIKSIMIQTVGLGGDSLISHNRYNMTIGPVRAAPLAWLANRWPHITEKIRFIYEKKNRHPISLCEFFYLVRGSLNDSFYSKEEIKIVSALRDGPLSILDLAEAVGTSIYFIELKRIEQLGIIMRCGLTPTDIMHLTGDFTAWNKEAAHLGALIMARQLNIEVDELISKVYENIKEALYLNIVKMLLEDESETILTNGISEQLHEILTMSYKKGREKMEKSDAFPFMSLQFSTIGSLVGIGAPVHIFLPDVAKVLNANCVIPENAAVANAVGAVTGNVIVEENVLIKPQYEIPDEKFPDNIPQPVIDRYLVLSSLGRKEFFNYNEAVEWAKEKAYQAARKTALERGSENVDIQVSVNDIIFDMSKMQTDDIGYISPETLKFAFIPEQKPAGNGEKKLLMETTVTARAVGKIKWI